MKTWYQNNLRTLQAVAIALFIVFIVTIPAMYLWNGCLVGAIDGFHPVTYLQMLGLIFLTYMLRKMTDPNR